MMRKEEKLYFTKLQKYIRNAPIEELQSLYESVTEFHDVSPILTHFFVKKKDMKKDEKISTNQLIYNLLNAPIEELIEEYKEVMAPYELTYFDYLEVLSELGNCQIYFITYDEDKHTKLAKLYIIGVKVCSFRYNNGKHETDKYAYGELIRRYRALVNANGIQRLINIRDICGDDDNRGVPFSEVLRALNSGKFSKCNLILK